MISIPKTLLKEVPNNENFFESFNSLSLNLILGNSIQNQKNTKVFCEAEISQVNIDDFHVKKCLKLYKNNDGDEYRIISTYKKTSTKLLVKSKLININLGSVKKAVQIFVWKSRLLQDRKDINLLEFVIIKSFMEKLPLLIDVKFPTPDIIGFWHEKITWALNTNKFKIYSLTCKNSENGFHNEFSLELIKDDNYFTHVIENLGKKEHLQDDYILISDELISI